MSSAFIPNPHHAGAPARMADGRLFTDYRPNCSLLAPLSLLTWDDYGRKRRMVTTGEVQAASDRSLLVLRGGAQGCVDTMVPELKKRIYTWAGPAGVVTAHPVGVGTGRMYLPGRPELATADPDVLAAATFPMPGTFVPNPQLYSAAPLQRLAANRPVAGPRNRYASPYGQ